MQLKYSEAEIHYFKSRQKRFSPGSKLKGHRLVKSDIMRQRAKGEEYKKKHKTPR